MKTATGVLLLIAGWRGSPAAELSHIYPPATLQAHRARYERTTNKILDELIWPALFVNEKAAFGNRKPVLELPLYADGDSRDNPLAFYSRYKSRPGYGNDLVVMPIFSLKFLDDLTIAYAWLQANNYTVETVSEYTAILFYGKPPAAGFPPPLEALRIPPNALERKDIDQAALGDFVSARAFTVLHEMGHIMYRHGKTQNPAESIRQEQQSDALAAMVMKRIGLPPLGMFVYFLADAHWTGIGESGSHPMSGARVNALASAVDDPVWAANLRQMGKWIDEPELRQGLVATGVAGDLAALGPRRFKELARISGRSQTGGTQAFDGVYRGEINQFLETGAIPAELTLERRGDSVTGRIAIGVGFFTIKSGRVAGNRLYFDWEFGRNYGQGVLDAVGSGRLTGTWGYRELRSGAGTMSASPAALGVQSLRQ
jgi:hypothetical protein